MPMKPSYLPDNLLDLFSQGQGQQQLDDAVSQLRAPSLLEDAISGINDTYHRASSIFTPLPIVVSDRPDALKIGVQPQASSGQPTAMPSAPPVPETPSVPIFSASDFSHQDGQSTYTPSQPTSGQPAAMPSASQSFEAGPRTGDPSGGVEQWDDKIQAASKKYNVPVPVIKGIMHIESGGNPNAVSAAGAMSLMQVMPFHFGPGENGMDPDTSIDRGTKILADNFARYKDWDKAAAAYFGAIDPGTGRITDATDATGTSGSNYVRLFRDAAGRYAGAPQTAGAPQPAASPSSPPAQAATSPAQPAAGGSTTPRGELVIRNARTGQTLRALPSEWGTYYSAPEWEIVSGAPTMQKAAPDLPDTGMSPGDQKRAKLAASGVPEAMPAAPMKFGQAVLPAPDGAYDVTTEQPPLQGQRVDTPINPQDGTIDGPDGTYGVRYRQQTTPRPGTDRPIQNPDGSVTTERSITVTDDRLNGGRATNIPTVWNGRIVSDDEAIDNAARSGIAWPSFANVDDAVRAAEQRSRDLGTGQATSVGGAAVPPEVQNALPYRNRAVRGEPINEGPDDVQYRQPLSPTMGCYDRKTDVLTAEGWKSWSDTGGSDIFATLNPTTGSIEYQQAVRLIRYRHTGEMYRVRSRGVDLLVTPDHRMWVRTETAGPFRFMTAREVSGRRVEYLSLEQMLPSTPSRNMVDRGLSDVVASCNLTMRQAILQQAVNAQNGRRSQLGVISSFTLRRSALREHVFDVISVGSEKQVVWPHAGRVVASVEYVLRRRQRKAMLQLVRETVCPPFSLRSPHLDHAISSPGHRSCPQPALPQLDAKDGAVLVHLRPKAASQGFRGGQATGCATRCGTETAGGLSATLWVGEKVSPTCLASARNGTLTGHHDLLNPGRGVCPGRVSDGSGHRSNYTRSSKWIAYDDEVFCATVPNGLLIVRRNGKVVVSGNSDTGQGGDAPPVPTSNYNDPTAGGTQDQPLPSQTQQPSTYGQSSDDPGQVPVQPAPQPEQPSPIQQAISWAGGKLLPIVNAAGDTLGYLHANQQQNQQAVTDANQGQDGGVNFGEGARRAYETVSPYIQPMGGLPDISARMRQIEQQAAIDQGVAADPVHAMRALNDPAWRAQNPELAAEYDDLQNNYLLGVGGLAEPIRPGPTVADANAGPNVVQRVRSALGANQERVAAADARMAEQGSTVAPGTLGVISGNPLDANTAVRSRIIPPDVADSLDFPVRVPTDPATVRAIEAAGGTVDPDKGVTLNVIRYQGPEAHGQTATRSSTFYTADKPGAPSPYASGAKAQTGGTDRIEGPTRFRSPLVLSDAPGDNAGFDAGMAQLWPPASESARDAAQAAWEEARTKFPAKFDKNYNMVPSPEETAAWNRLQALDPPEGRAIDQEISAARQAGPPGSPERAQALKDLVTRYGGDPDVIDSLLAVRGADDSESAWAIKENILAHNARKAGYDGVLTVQQSMSPSEYQNALEKAVQAHPDYKAQQDVIETINQEIDRLEAQRKAIPSQGGDLDRAYAHVDNAIEDAMGRATDAEIKLQKVHDRLLDEVHVDAPSKITELADFRESHNPTPGAPHEAEQARVRYESLQKEAFDAQRRLGIDDPETKRLWGEAEQAYAEYEQHGGAYGAPYNPQPPGYTLRPDMRQRGGETTATGTPGIGASSRILGDVANSIGGGVGGATIGAGLPAENDEERRRNALIGAGVGMVAGPAAGRLMSREGGALATMGVGPGNVKSPSQSANPNIRNVARMMSGDYKTVGTERPLGERIVAALTDRYAIHANVAAEGRARALASGSAAPVERLAERVRENPNSIAAQRTRETLAPALQSLGSDDEWAAQYLVHRHNLDIAKEKAQEVYDAAIAKGRTPQQAQAVADRVRTSRQFSGGMTEKEIIQAISDMQTEIGPSRFKKVVDAAQAFWDSGRENLQRKLDEGIIDQDTFNTLTQKYPHYVRTDIADYAEKGPANPSPGGKALGIGNQGIKVLSIEGTSKDRVNPILSTIDAVYATENAITRNKAARDLVAVRDADPTTAGLFREVAPDAKAYRGNQQTMVPPDYTLRNGEQKMTQWDNGVARQFVVPSEYAQLLTPNPGALLGDTASPVRTFFGVMKALITTHNPAFQYIVSPTRDVGDAMVSMQTAAGAAARRPGASGIENTAREAAGAVAAIPEAIYRLGEAIPQAFQGFASNNVGPRVAELRRAGMGFESRPSGEHGLREAMRELQRSGGVEIKTPGDALRIGRTILSLGAERVGNRLEMVPRIAAANMERARGGDALSQSIAGKEATVDFLRGGWLTRQLNVPMMYLNPTVQAAAQNARLYRKSPAAFTAALITTVGIPALLSEAWNRSDPERAKAYEDRPDYLSNTGIVWEMPNLPQGTGPLKEKLPNFVWQPLGNHAFAARLAREALGLMDSKTGLIPPTPTPAADRSDPSYWVKLGTDLLGMFSPVKGGDVSSSVASLVPPVASEALDLAANKDLYTGATIASDRTDERASNLSKTIASGANSLLGTEWRPSQVEHAIAGPTGYAGQLARAASDIGRQQEQTRPIQDIPGVGGLAGRIIRDTGGQRLQDERDAATASAAVRQALRDAGLRSDEIGMPSSNIRDLPITRVEQAGYQRDFNAILDKNVREALADPDWKTMSEFERARWLKNLATQARQEAGGNVVGGWDDPTLEFRADKKAEKRTGVK